MAHKPGVNLPPGYVGNPDTQQRFKFIQEQKDRKYTQWQAANDPQAEIDPKTRKVNYKRTGYVKDETEGY